MASSYPGSLDDFATTSPTNLGDDDAKGRIHSERHNDMESAMEAVQAELGTDPAGAQATVKARLDVLTMGAFGHFYWPAGGYISNAHADGVTSTTGALTSDLLYYTPIWVPVSATVTSIQVSVSSGATGSAYLGLYSSSSTTGQPDSLVVDGGTVGVSTTGVKSVTVSVAVVPGVYWVAFVTQNAPTLASPDVDAARMIASDSSFGKVRGFTQSHTYGALPSSASSLSATSMCVLVGLGR